jgi:Type I phosphodiesterase / nucleotide pyrophosphatase
MYRHNMKSTQDSIIHNSRNGRRASLAFVGFLLLLVNTFNVNAQDTSTENLIVVTLDGFRWQELFKGGDPKLLRKAPGNTLGNNHPFVSGTESSKRRSLMPFMWSVIGSQGQLHGNRAHGNRVDCSNPHLFSYPGYSEMFTGHVDRKVKSNAKQMNKNSNVLEYIHQTQGFQDQVAVFSTWDVMPFILRTSETGIVSNHSSDPAVTRKSDDSTTFHSAFHYLQTERPRLLYISLSRTDGAAHRGDYVQYLQAAHRTDEMLEQLWTWIQSDPQYNNKTTLIITTDHGRGTRPFGSWKKHGSITPGSRQIWMAVMGPDTPSVGEVKTNSTISQKQIAKTLAAFLGINYRNEHDVGESISAMIAEFRINGISE